MGVPRGLPESGPGDGPTAVDLRSALLPFTIRNALNIPFYREHWNGCGASNVRTVEQLANLPALTKSAYRESLMHASEAVRNTSFVSHSTGTTGALTWRHRTHAEATVIQQVFGTANGVRPPMLTLSLASVDLHGMMLSVPGAGHSMPGRMSEDVGVTQCLEMITQEFHFNNVTTKPTAIVGNAPDIALLAQALLEHQLADKHSIDLLTVMGYVHVGLTDMYNAVFRNPTIVNRYSLSEIFGGATKADGLQSYTVDPYVIAEVVDESDAALPRGRVGELTFTELFPFVQQQPLIRYRSGDMARRLEDCPRTGCLRFDWIGKRDRCVIGDSGRGMAFRQVSDWLSLTDVAARSSHRPHLTSIVSTDVGRPCLSMCAGTEQNHAIVSIGLRINPWLDTAELRAFVAGLWDVLRHSLWGSTDLLVEITLTHVLGALVELPADVPPGSRRFIPSLLSGPPPIEPAAT